MIDNTVLLATDFSADADLALEHACAYARSKGLGVLIVHVMHVPAMSDGEGMLHDGAGHDETISLTQRLKDLADSVSDVPCEHRLLLGEPAAEILREADERKASLIVMGTHGRTGVRRLVMGSVAERVVRGAACSVLVVKRPRA